MRHYGLIGRHLSHSFSANFFRVKFQNERIDADYTLIEVEDISTIRNIVIERELSGFNVTIPYKESIIPYLDELSEEAKAVGAVNCVVVRGGRLVGYNTDITGIEASLEWMDVDMNARALILGTGGAAKAVQYVLSKYNLAYSTVSRDKERGDYTYDMLDAIGTQEEMGKGVGTDETKNTFVRLYGLEKCEELVQKYTHQFQFC